MWNLTRGDNQCTIDPRGGRLTRFHSRGCDVLVPQPSTGGFLDGLPLFGSFPMVPFANRLEPPHLQSSSGPVRFASNWPSEGLAMHGVAYDAPWQVVERTEDALKIEIDITDADEQRIGRGGQQFQLTEQGLDISLSFTNTELDRITAGVGMHPWFCAPLEVEFVAAQRLLAGPDVMPRDLEAISRVILKSGADDGHDLCYGGFAGEAVVRTPDWPNALIVRTKAPCLHVFVGDRFGAVCIEPVSHAPNALHNAISQSVAPMAHLARGESVSVDLSLRWRDLAVDTGAS